MKLLPTIHLTIFIAGCLCIFWGFAKHSDIERKNAKYLRAIQQFDTSLETLKSDFAAEQKLYSALKEQIEEIDVLTNIEYYAPTASSHQETQRAIDELDAYYLDHIIPVLKDKAKLNPEISEHIYAIQDQLSVIQNNYQKPLQKFERLVGVVKDKDQYLTQSAQVKQHCQTQFDEFKQTATDYQQRYRRLGTHIDSLLLVVSKLNDEVSYGHEYAKLQYKQLARANLDSLELVLNNTPQVASQHRSIVRVHTHSFSELDESHAKVLTGLYCDLSNVFVTIGISTCNASGNTDYQEQKIHNLSLEELYQFNQKGSSTIHTQRNSSGNHPLLAKYAIQTSDYFTTDVQRVNFWVAAIKGATYTAYFTTFEGDVAHDSESRRLDVGTFVRYGKQVGRAFNYKPLGYFNAETSHTPKAFRSLGMQAEWQSYQTAKQANKAGRNFQNNYQASIRYEALESSSNCYNCQSCQETAAHRRQRAADKMEYAERAMSSSDWESAIRYAEEARRIDPASSTGMLLLIQKAESEQRAWKKKQEEEERREREERKKRKAKEKKRKEQQKKKKKKKSKSKKRRSKGSGHGI